MDQDEPHKHQSGAETESKAEQKNAKNQTAYWGDVGRFLNYIFSEHWLGLVLVACALGFIFIALTTIDIKPIWWAIGGAVLFMILITFALLYVGFARGKSAPTAYHPLTLKQLFAADFPTGSLNSELIVGSNKDDSRQKIPYRVVTDFHARSKFIAFFVPHSADALDLCRWLAENFQFAMTEVEKSVSVTMSAVGEATKTDMSELTFSGRVFIYHEDRFSLQELADLEKFFNSRNAAVIFRGHDYLAFQWSQKRTP